jgi:phosphatidylserine/phosphatidylglycerophosphate/cardiolipin synthase-like enzyme
MAKPLFHALVVIGFLSGCLSGITGVGGDDDDGGGSTVGEDTLDSDALPDGIIASAKSTREAFFAVPLADGTKDGSLETKVIELIDAAPPGTRIRIAMFRWRRISVSNALIAASQRGVQIQLVLDRQANEVEDTTGVTAPPGGEAEDTLEDDAEADPTTTWRSTGVLAPAVQALVDNLPAGSVTFCTRGHGSCIGKQINHNKFYMFSSTGGANHVVVQSSANLTTHLLHNNLVISRNDPALYSAYFSYFADLKAHKENLDYYRSEAGDHTIAYFFPRAEGDTIVNVLDRVKCTNNSKVRVTMAFFTSGRTSIADKLVSLKHAGCDVAVNMRKVGKGSDAAIIDLLRSGKVSVGLYPDGAGSNIHSKYLLIDSQYETNGAYERRKLVWTGSHNYNTNALRDNDETVLRVDDPAVFDAFDNNWNVIRAQIDGV